MNAKVQNEAVRIADEYGLDLGVLEQRREAVEEVLANMAENGVQNQALDRFIAWLRRAIRRVFGDLRLSDGEIRNLISRARLAVTEGAGVRGEAGMESRMSKSSSRRKALEEAIVKIAAGEDEATMPGLRPDLEEYGGSPDVTIVWGEERKGLLHVGSRRGPQVVREVLETVLDGAVSKFVSGKKTVHLVRGEYEAVLSLDEHGQRKTWLLTG